MSKLELASGQIWALRDSKLHIGLVGKTLVHYKHYKGQMKRAPVSLESICDLQQYLRRHRAVLHQKGENPPEPRKSNEP